MTADKINEDPYYALVFTKKEKGLVVHTFDEGLEPETIITNMRAQIKTVEQKFYKNFKEKI